MASSSFLLETPTSIFSSSSTKNFLNLRKQFPFLVKVKRHPQKKRSFLLKSALDEVSVFDPPPPPSEGAKIELIASLKIKLLVSLVIIFRTYFWVCAGFCSFLLSCVFLLILRGYPSLLFLVFCI